MAIRKAQNLIGTADDVGLWCRQPIWYGESVAEWSFNPQSEDLVIIYFKQVPLNKVAQAGVGPGGFFAIKEDFKMLDASALFTQS